jgi:Holliday junction resolvase RusA-like endonuclease
MAYKLEIEIPTEATDANKTMRGNKFAHNAVKQKIKRDIELLVRNKKPEFPLELFKISVTRHGARALDWDNLISSLKAYIDGLVVSGIIANDSWRYVRQINTDQKIGKEKKLVIKVEELIKESSIAAYDELLEAI